MVKGFHIFKVTVIMVTPDTNTDHYGELLTVISLSQIKQREIFYWILKSILEQFVSAIKKKL